MESGLGIQTVSNRHSLPAYSFAFRNPIPAYKRFGPGPAAYGASSSIGTRACDGVKKNAPIYKFGTDKTREKAGTERATEPSPSDYQNFHKQTPGHYQVSRHRTAPASSFGLKPPPSKSLYSGPGPNSYNTTWNRTTSRKNTAAYGFGTSTREKPRSKARDRSPGKALPEPGPITYSPQAEKWKVCLRSEHHLLGLRVKQFLYAAKGPSLHALRMESSRTNKDTNRFRADRVSHR
eukprot:gb/GECG01012000.1/.p1 GENE.gb/GECG01012000.1/~~gb/GECG01012000.1/.p1  ORF type:complete len:235 (+),score=7.55 gb/GECG01012000.1/:1-705(+)